MAEDVVSLCLGHRLGNSLPQTRAATTLCARGRVLRHSCFSEGHGGTHEQGQVLDCWSRMGLGTSLSIAVLQDVWLRRVPALSFLQRGRCRGNDRNESTPGGPHAHPYCEVC